MISRRALLVAPLALLVRPDVADAQASTPSAAEIERQLQAPLRTPVPPQSRVTVPELTRRPDLRAIAPSIEIQSINFSFGSAAIARSEYWKIENIAIALRHLLQRNPRENFLMEGHTDAVGSRSYNQLLSERRAASVKRVLVQFGIPSGPLHAVGYGEDYLLVPVPYAEWRNRRVTMRRVTDIIRPF